MAARKKAKSKTQRKKAPVRKPVIRGKAAPAKKKVAPAKKKTAAKKTTARRAAPKKKPVVQRVAAVKQPTPRPQPAATTRPASPVPAQPAKPAAEAAPATAPAPQANEERIGTVTHYYSHLSVAVVRMESGSLRVGDMIHITGHTSDFRQRVESIQIEHASAPEVGAGQEFGLKVIEHAREHDVVYKVTTQ